MGNISKTYIDYNVRPAMFVKEDCSKTGFDFHSLLYHTAPLVGKFSINQPLTITGTKARFELVPDLDFDVTIENSKLFGANMAAIHNHSAKLMLSKELPYMDNKIMPDADSWKELNISAGELSIREIIMKFSKYVPIKTLPLHRDFRLHNIMFGADYYHLIDFDFAAYDDVSMEVMGMVVDLLEHGFEYVEAFLRAYMESSNIDTYDYMASNYLIYLASSCFPYDRIDTLEPEAFDILANERTSRLIRLYLNMDNIAKFFQDK
tara:strand:+ start:629 stop:1417 length:789 start_codon:yes stop_codon:yes gene_type:complete